MKVRKIISGGQTGADLAAFDAARSVGVSYGGWVPKGRLNEAGVIANRYTNLKETPTEVNEERTRLNVLDADATLIISHGALSGGSLYTIQQAHLYQIPCLHLNLNQIENPLEALSNWLDTVDGGILNVAGPRESEDEEIYQAVFDLVKELLQCQ